VVRRFLDEATRWPRHGCHARRRRRGWRDVLILGAAAIAPFAAATIVFGGRR
jgi:hypothetical protein